jgi:DNA polymerase III epsilon subunit-like protein
MPKEPKPKTGLRTSKHYNHNLLCAIDTETTGLTPGKHDIIQICVMPVTPDLKPNFDIPFFHLKIQPKRPEVLEDEDPRNSKMNRPLISDAIINGMDPWTAVDRFDEWFKELHLPERKQIIPLGCNYTFDKGFLLDWLGGYINYEHYFRNDFRDVQLAAGYINDCCDWHSEQIPFPKWKLTYLCHCLGIEHSHAHDAVHDCIATIAVYRALMTLRDAGSFLPKTIDLPKPLDEASKPTATGTGDTLPDSESL